MDSFINFLGWLTFLFTVLPVMVMLIISTGISLHGTLAEYLDERKQRKTVDVPMLPSEDAELKSMEARDGHAILAVIILLVIIGVATAINAP